MLNKIVTSAAFRLTVMAMFWLSCQAEAGRELSVDGHAGEVLEGEIYQKGSNLQRLLFNFRRMARRSGNETHVTRTYTYPDGRVAAIEKAKYREGELVSYNIMEKQINAHGRAKIRGDAQQGSGQIAFSYSRDGETSTDVEDLEANTVVNDTIVPYMLTHWDELMRGEEISARYIVISRTETVGFTLAKSGEATWRGEPVVIIKMAPSSFFVSLIVDPVYFTVEKDTRQVVKYAGRTTPKVKQDGEWRDLDAVTVFRWRPESRHNH